MPRGPKGPAQKTKQQSAAEVAELARMSRLAADLSEGLMPEQYAREMLIEGERRLGMRCQGCGQRVTVGFKFRRLDPINASGRPTLDVSELTACKGLPLPDGDGVCDFAEEARKGATSVEMVEYAWLAPDPSDPGWKLPAPPESSPEAAGDGAPDPAPPPAGKGEAASASGEGSSIELPPGVSRE